MAVSGGSTVIDKETVITRWLAKGKGAGKKFSLDMNTLMAREGRTLLTRSLDYKPSRNRPYTSLVRLYAILVPSTDDVN